VSPSPGGTSPTLSNGDLPIVERINGHLIGIIDNCTDQKCVPNAGLSVFRYQKVTKSPDGISSHRRWSFMGGTEFGIGSDQQPV
jgi:hypothetical protein